MSKKSTICSISYLLICSLFLACNETAKPPSQQTSYLSKFDGLDFLFVDSCKSTHQNFQVALTEGELYQYSTGDQKAVFIADSFTIRLLQSGDIKHLQSYNSKASRSLNAVIQYHSSLIKNISSYESSLDSITHSYSNKSLSFDNYAQNKKRLLDSITGAQLVYKNQIIQLIDTDSLTVIPTFLLSLTQGDSTLFSIERDLPLFEKVRDRYALRSFANSAISNFIKYVDAYVGYQDDRQVRLAKLLTGATPVNIILPDKNGKKEELYNTLSKSSYTFLLFIRNSCETCNTERAALQKIYPTLKKHDLRAFEVSVDEDVSFQDWTKTIASKFNYEWIQVKDTLPYAKSTSFNFDVIATPTTYLLRNNRIIAKNVPISALDSLTSYN